MYVSTGLMPAARTETTTCLGPGLGSGTSSTFITDGGPNSCTRMALMGFSASLCRNDDDTLTRMIAVHLENRRASIRNIPKPRRPEGYALVRLLYGGICNTDLELLRGYYGFSGTPGHEFVGEVVAADNPRLVGRRVVGEINLACRRCGWCKRG